MCLGTVERRLAAGWYWDANHCHRDIQQVKPFFRGFGTGTVAGTVTDTVIFSNDP